MNTSKIAKALAATLTLGLLASSVPAQAEWFDGRQANQRERIRDGVSTGALTRGEARHLRRQQRHIRRLEDRLAADGHFSRRDRRKLNHALDRASRRIARAKHNDRYRGDGRPRGRGWRGRGRGHWHDVGQVTEIHNHYEPAPAPEPVPVESPAFNRSFEVDFDGVRVIWSASGPL